MACLPLDLYVILILCLQASFRPTVAGAWQAFLQNDTTTGTPPMIGRKLTISEWLEYVQQYDFGSLAPSILTLHHTWKPTVEQWHGLATMRGMQTHYAAKGWGSAPHIYTAPDGIWLFTPMDRIGIHAGELNGSLKQGWYSIGVEMVGDYDKTLPTGPVWNNTLAVLGGLTKRLNIPFSKLLTFHRDASTKSCPGWKVTREWVYREVAAWLQPPPLFAPYTEDSPILGIPRATMERVIEQILSRPIVNPKAPRPYTEQDVRSVIIPAYWQQARAVGIDPVLAIAQMLHETGNLTSFWAQRPQRNPAGIGVDGTEQAHKPDNLSGWAFNYDKGVWAKGISFADWEKESIPAQLGRLLAYALPAGQGTLTQQALVKKALAFRGLPPEVRGTAPTLKKLGKTRNPSGKGWASPGDDYGAKIAATANWLMGYEG